MASGGRRDLTRAIRVLAAAISAHLQRYLTYFLNKQMADQKVAGNSSPGLAEGFCSATTSSPKIAFGDPAVRQRVGGPFNM